MFKYSQFFNKILRLFNKKLEIMISSHVNKINYKVPFEIFKYSIYNIFKYTGTANEVNFYIKHQKILKNMYV